RDGVRVHAIEGDEDFMGAALAHHGAGQRDGIAADAAMARAGRLRGLQVDDEAQGDYFLSGVSMARWSASATWRASAVMGVSMAAGPAAAAAEAGEGGG